MGYIIPQRIKPDSDQGYFSQLSKAVFQAGFSYKVVEQKWPDITEAFENFNFDSIALWDEEIILFVVQSPKVIRNIKKYLLQKKRRKKRILNMIEKFMVIFHLI